MWLLVAIFLVFIMQAGFLCFESGSTRSKNNINVAAKNVLDFAVSASLFWLFGFGLMFGSSNGGFIGSSHFFFGEDQSADALAFFLFHMMFCGTAATLTSGAAAERMKFWGYVYITIILSVLIYPVVGHWTWGGLFLSDNAGWLESLGFVDFAGATVVHSVGGWFALATVLVLGARRGRFDSDAAFPSGSNLPMAALGVFLIWLGWFGFNGGSALEYNDQVPGILLNTTLSAIWASLALTLVHYLHKKYVDVSYSLNGIIAGLVGITAACHTVSPKEAAVIGMVSGLLMYLGSIGLQKLKIDDALSVVPAHLLTGIWGTLAVAIFGDLEVLGTGLSAAQQLQVQAFGIAVIGFYSFTVSYLCIRLINHFIPIRVSADHETIGLNISEHNAKTELIDLLTDMERQQQQGLFTTPLKEEPFTEVGQIARKYNQVIERVANEMSERDHTQNEFKNSQQRKSAILDSSMDSVICISTEGIIVEFNHTAERTFGCLKKHVIGEPFIEHFVNDNDQDSAKRSLLESFSSGDVLVLNRRNQVSLRRLTGDTFPAEVTITSAQLGDDGHVEYTLIIRDVAKELKLQSRLKYLAYKDPLTNLSNRTHMIRQLKSFISNAKRENLSVALFFLDLDKFKKINDTFGHKAGDDLLCEVADRLQGISRDSDLIARWGGDEFIYIILGKLNQTVIEHKAETILSELRKNIEIGRKLYQIPTSIGIAVSENGNIDADKLIQQADIAMYHAKEQGRDNYQFFSAEMGERAAKFLTLEQEIRNAIKLGQIYLTYQPKVKHNMDKVIGLEALARWHHPIKGEIFPSEFIPVAEESDLIIDLGEFVIEAALRQIVRLKVLGLVVTPISVNISGRHLISDNFVPFVAEKLKEYKVQGDLLEIEITEHMLIQDIEQCITVLKKVKSLGVRISIDGFGKGYSSLNYLKRPPIDILKIDRSFVNECDTVTEDREICSAIISLASSLRLDTVAGGVETREQANTLINLGCTKFQGYLFYRPLKQKDLEKLLKKSVKHDHLLDSEQMRSTV